MTNMNKKYDRNSFSNGLKDAWLDGIIDSLPDDCTDEVLASEITLQLGKDYSKYKSLNGLICRYRSNRNLMEWLYSVSSEKVDWLSQKMISQSLNV